MKNVAITLLLLLSFGCAGIPAKEHNALKDDVQIVKRELEDTKRLLLVKQGELEEKTSWLWHFHKKDREYEERREREEKYGVETFSPCYDCSEIYEMGATLADKGIKTELIMSELKNKLGILLEEERCGYDKKLECAKRRLEERRKRSAEK